MAINCIDKNPLQRGGTTQSQRLLAALDPANVQLMEMGMEEWLKFARSYAEKLNYYPPDHVPGSDTSLLEDWRPFWPSDDEIKTIAENLDEDNGQEPHLALFLAFVKLLEHSKSHFNSLTQTHLDHYYKRILQLKKKPAKPDKVHLIFELAKNVVQHRIEKGTAFKAGKDARGIERIYLADEEVVLNSATVEHLRTIYHKKGTGLFYAPVAKSLDGLGGDLPEGDKKWSAFGHAELPRSRIGFSLASPILRLKEGVREVRVFIEFDKEPEEALEDLFQEEASVFLSGEKEWIGPLVPQGIVETELSEAEKKFHMFFSVTLNKDADPVVPYNPEVHGEQYSSQEPVMQILFDTMPEAKGYQLYEMLEGLELKRLAMHVNVQEMQDVSVENDFAILDPSKPFLPFGPQPTRGSNFYVGNEEIFTKNWNKVDIKVTWKDMPTSLRDHYEAYTSKYIDSNGNAGSFSKAFYTTVFDKVTRMIIVPISERIVGNNSYFKAKSFFLKNKRWVEEPPEKTLFADSSSEHTITVEPNNEADDAENTSGSATVTKPGYKRTFWRYFRANLPLRSLTLNYLFRRNRKPVRFNYKPYRLQALKTVRLLPRLSPRLQDGFVRLSLTTDFFHKAYAKLLAMALSGDNQDLAVPKQPYTPEIEKIELNYSATIEQVVLDKSETDRQVKLQDFNDKKIQLFHERPFGQTEEHIFLKEQDRSFSVDLDLLLTPRYPEVGVLLIGLKEAANQQTISLLIQVAEGSENPLAEPFGPNEGLSWYILCSNEWKPLEPDFKIADTANNFLRSGIVRFVIPQEATNENTVLEDGYFWVKVVNNKTPDTVAQLFEIKAQALSATFLDQGNELSHLETALPAGTIAKFKERKGGVKKVEQPYSSFGGRPLEKDVDFYRRVSERLRHKSRAVNIWDYEHLVLEAFPQIYKVKCLNHTKVREGFFEPIADETATTRLFEEERLVRSELAPGHVTLVVIPDTTNKNIYDPFKPRASQQLLSEIEDFVSKSCSMHVRYNAINADFEEVRLTFDVKLKKDFDPSFYEVQLNQDIIDFLSPWASGKEADIAFGATVYRSMLIHFIDRLEYVDFVANFEIEHRNAAGNLVNERDATKITATNSWAILVSHPSHVINTIEQNC